MYKVMDDIPAANRYWLWIEGFCPSCGCSGICVSMDAVAEGVRVCHTCAKEMTYLQKAQLLKDLASSTQ